MDDLHPINRALITVLDNQDRRTEFAFDALPDEIYNAEPGGDCNSIRRIGEHLIRLRQFQLLLLESPLAEGAPSMDSGETAAQLVDALREGSALVRRAIELHDGDDWYTVPDPPREGRWGDEATIDRFIRPFNDYTNHLGAVRAIRRMMGAAADQTQ